jgi:hypothetical protein
LGFTTSNITVYALFLVPPDTVNVIVIVLPRLTGTVGLIARLYGATPSTRGAAAEESARARATRGIKARSLVSI